MAKSLMWLVGCMLDNISIRCDTDTHRDNITISRRIKHEGLSFLTIALPAFSVDFERSLAEGQVGPHAFLGFRRRGALPVFLRGLLIQVFDPMSGKLLEGESIDAIASVRQLCLMFKKVGLPCSTTRTRRSFHDFLQVEQELTEQAGRVSERRKEFRSVSAILWSGLAGNLTRKIEDASLIPRHGPGATAERISRNGKYAIRTWHSRLEWLFPLDGFALPLGSANGYLKEGPSSDLELLDPGSERPVRVVSVPKTLKSPRIIAIEPVCMQYIQQSISIPMMKIIERDRTVGGHLNFSDQRINRRIARDASKNGTHATIDLSEASDRVSLELVTEMLWFAPLLKEAILACRSTSAVLPDGQTVHLRKFASMGSALCFPIESMVFFTLCVQSLLKARNLPVTPWNVKNVSKEIYVYGDDIIVPVNEVSTVIDHLTDVNLKVNKHKSFWTGQFRESCGMDAYAGEDVTPVYVRSMPPCNRRDTSELLSFVSLANQLYQRGWWVTAKRVREFVESIFKVPLPLVLESSPCLGWVSFLQRYSVQRWNKDLHRPEVKGFVPSPAESDDPLSGYPALMKYFLKRGSTPIFGKHLERSVRPGSVNIKYRWVTPY